MRDILSQAEREPGRGPHSRQADMEGEGGLARQAGGRVLLPPRLGTGLPRTTERLNNNRVFTRLRYLNELNPAILN